MAAIDDLLTAIAVNMRELRHNVKRWGATGDGSTDDRAAIQAAIDAVGQGVLYFPRGVYMIDAPLQLGDGTILVGDRPNYGYLSGGVGTTIIKAKSAMTDMITAKAATITAAGIDGIDLSGNGVAQNGVHWPTANWCTLRNMGFVAFTRRYVKLDSGMNSRLAHLLGTEGMMGAAASGTITAPIGCIELGGSDHLLTDMEISYTNNPAVTTSGMFITPLLMTATNCMSTNCVFEFGETGAVITGNLNKFAACRADNAGGHGWVIRGTGNAFVGCNADSNGKKTTNTSSSWRAEVPGNSFVGCVASSGAPNKPRFSFEDTVADSGQSNAWVGCIGKDHVTREWHVASPAGPRPQIAWREATVTDPAGSSVSVAGISLLVVDLTAAKTLTNLTGGIAGQELTIWTNSTNLTLSPSGTGDGKMWFGFGSANVTLDGAKAVRLVARGASGSVEWLRI